MPLERTGWLTDQRVAMERPEDIELVFEALRRVPSRGFFTQDRAQRELAEEVGYQLLVHPGWVTPHVDALVREGVAAAMTFDWLCLLMEHASATLIAEVVDRARADDKDTAATLLLLAARTPDAMAVVADLARSRELVRNDCRSFGVDVPTVGQAEPRFAIERRAIRFHDGTPVAGAPHAAGLPLSDVVAPGEDRITFHFLSVTPAEFPALPRWPGQAHIVSIRAWPVWTAFARPDPAGRLVVTGVDLDGDRSLDELDDLLDDAAVLQHPSGEVELLAFDDRLTYANQHPLLTPGVIGVLGGPPMGLAYAPTCPGCGRLMFHAGYCEARPREYGDGFRSLFLCERCVISATLATLWN
ncbi:MAG: hypothetical protein ABIR11_11525 [Candidatus Limnocylindrales bacterium]